MFCFNRVFVLVLVVGIIVGANAFAFDLFDVYNGDTFAAADPESGDVIHMRLWGVDAPLLSSFEGEVAKAYLETLLSDGFRVVPMGFDDDGIMLVVVWASSSNFDVQEQMLYTGLASHDVDVASLRDDYAAAQADAQARGLGVWRGD